MIQLKCFVNKGFLSLVLEMEDIFKLLDNCKNVDNFVKFFAFFKKSAGKFNLTSLSDDKEIIVKHFLDSLYGRDFLSENAKVVEIGSGGGFPSVPLKIERPDLDFTLIEATGKKCDYLNKVKELLSFDKFQVVNGRCEELAQKENYRGVYDYAVARAVAPLNILAEYLIPFLKVGGMAICYKGSNYEEEILKSQNALSKLNATVEEVYKYSLCDNLGDHVLIILKKTDKTKDLYPRTQSKIKKAPL